MRNKRINEEFKMKKTRIVKVNGKYAVQVRYGLFGWSFIDHYGFKTKDPYHYTDVLKNTIEQAREMRDRFFYKIEVIE